MVNVVLVDLCLFCIQFDEPCLGQINQVSLDATKNEKCWRGGQCVPFPT